MPGPSPTTDPSPTPSKDRVLETLRVMLTDIIGEDLLLDVDVEMDTSFDTDLQLESIEFVALAEKLVECYGERVDFVGWLAEMELDEIISLTVGDVVDFVTAAI